MIIPLKFIYAFQKSEEMKMKNPLLISSKKLMQASNHYHYQTPPKISLLQDSIVHPLPSSLCVIVNTNTLILFPLTKKAAAVQIQLIFKTETLVQI